MNFASLPFILDPSDNCDGIILNKDHLYFEHLFRINNASSSSTKLRFKNEKSKKQEPLLLFFLVRSQVFIGKHLLAVALQVIDRHPGSQRSVEINLQINSSKGNPFTLYRAIVHRHQLASQTDNLWSAANSQSSTGSCGIRIHTKVDWMASTLRPTRWLGVMGRNAAIMVPIPMPVRRLSKDDLEPTSAS